MLSLIFAEGARPTAATVVGLARARAKFGFAVSHTPPPEEGWLELLAMGMSFDCRGLAPAPGEGAPEAGTLLGLEEAPAGECVALAPGPHLAEGAGLLPVVRALTWLGCALAALPGVKAVCWRPAESWIEPGYFLRVAEAWLGGGPFPALGLTVLRAGRDSLIESHGLGFVIGQEIEIAERPGLDRAKAAPIALRLIGELVESGPVLRAEELTGPSGETLRLEPVADARRVRVTVLGQAA